MRRSRVGDDALHLLPTVRVGGIDIHAITESQCAALVCDQLDARRGGWVLTANLDHLRLIRSDAAYAALCEPATLRVADGMPVVWASRLHGTPLPERVAGSNLISTLTALAAERNRSVFLIGGEPGTAAGAATALQRRHPRLRVAGTRCPPFGSERSVPALQALLAAVQATAPDIVYVALSKPAQELTITHLRAGLPHSWFVGVGISFSFLSGAVRRAPLWVQHAGLEWAHRAIQEPRRLTRRYLTLLPFAVGFLATALLGRNHTPRAHS